MKLGDLMRKWRLASSLSVREAAAQIGLPSTTYHRLENGESVDGRTIVKLMIWMFSEGE